MEAPHAARASRAGRWRRLPWLLCVVAAMSLGVSVGVRQAHAADDDMAAYRDRFRVGMDRYRAGAMAEAIRLWRAIYEELGPKRGYRLSFDLARAYDTNGEATRAAERYRAFLDEVEVRRAAGEAIEPLVAREVVEAGARLEALAREHGRIEVRARPHAAPAQIDDTDPRLGGFVAYVAPGKHVVTFAPGTPNAHVVEVQVAAGELAVTEPPDEPEPIPAIDAQPFFARQLRHPFPAAVLYTGAIVTAASTAAPIAAYAHAYSLYETANSSTVSTSTRANAYSAYPGATTLYYGMLAVPIALAVGTAALTTWYVVGAKEHEVPVAISPMVAPGAAAFLVSGRF